VLLWRLFGRRFLLTAFIVYLLLPMVLVVVGSFGKKWFGTMFPEGFTWKWYRELFSNIIFTRALRMSFFIATLVVIANMVIGIPAVYAIYVSRKEYLKKLFDNFVMLPIAISPLVIGMGLIQVYNWPSFSLIGTWEILLFAHCVFTIPFMVKPVMANLEMINWRELDEASESLGASGWYKARRVFLPNLLPGIVAGSVMSFSISLGEFPLAVLLSGSTTQTYPVALYQAFYFPVGFACAATSLLLLAALFALLGMMFLMKFTHMRREDFAL
jgi:putative spermidine/putrescine transport system permease protein